MTDFSELGIEYDDGVPLRRSARRRQSGAHDELLERSRRQSRRIQEGEILPPELEEDATEGATLLDLPFGGDVEPLSRRMFMTPMPSSKPGSAPAPAPAPKTELKPARKPKLIPPPPPFPNPFPAPAPAPPQPPGPPGPPKPDPNKPKPPPNPPADQPRRVRIDGRVLTVVDRGEQVVASPNRLWNKEERHNLPGEVRQLFFKSATGYVLGKHSKLQQQSMRADEDGALEKVLSLHFQLEQLRHHCESHDMIDVCTIVFPRTNFVHSPTIQGHVSLFQDYARLTPDVVANSCYWYNRYVDQAYVRENMMLIYKLLQNNTDEQLWTKSLEEYHEYQVVQQGGPLMLIIILQRIQNSSETAVLHLKNSLRNLKISSLEGENVDKAVSLVKSTHRLLIAASTDSHNYVPDDFPHTVLKVYQTSSVAEFNRPFARLEEEALIAADIVGKLPTFPEVTELNQLATNLYARLKQDGWCDQQKSKSRALTSRPTNTGHDGKSKRKPPVCWNCGGAHLLPACKKPHDKAKIDAAKAAFNKQKEQRRKTKVGKDGRPMILNKKGVYVLDTKAWKEKKEKQASALDTLQKALEAKAFPETSPSADAPVTETPKASRPDSPHVHFSKADIDAAFKTMSLS